MSYCLYLRKSRADAEAEARGEGETLARHQSTLMATAKALGLSVTEIYKEIVSGDSIAARPVMQHLLSEVEQGIWQGVLVMEIERLARGDTIDQGIVAQTFQYSSTLIITPTKTYDPNNEFDREYFEFGLFMSRREYQTIKRRLQIGRQSSIKEGKYVSSKPPYGYDRIKLKNQKGFSLIPNSEQAPIVQLIFDWYTNGFIDEETGNKIPVGLNKIVTFLNKMGAKPISSEFWTLSTVRSIISNEVYAGWIRWNFRPTVKYVENGVVKTSRPRVEKEKRLLYKGLHKPIISQETFDKAQYLLKTKSRPGPISKEMTNPLSGILYCAECGHAMTRRSYLKRGYDTKILCNYTYCQTVSSNFDVIENILIESLKLWLNDLKLENKKLNIENSIGNDILTLKNAEQSALKKIELVCQQEQKAYALVEQGIYTPEVFLARSKALAKQKDELIKSARSISEEINKLNEINITKNKIIPKLEKVINIYPSLVTAEEKNQLLKSVLEKATYHKTKKALKRGCIDVGDLKLTIYPKLPN